METPTIRMFSSLALIFSDSTTSSKLRPSAAFFFAAMKLTIWRSEKGL